MVSGEAFREAQKRGETRRRRDPIAISARYDKRSGRIVVALDTGLEISFLPDAAQGLDGTRPRDLERVEITPSGLGLHFPLLDADLYLPALLEGFMGSRKWMAARLGQAGGAVRSVAKAASSRENGRLGGRPPKVVSSNLPKGGGGVRSPAFGDRSQVFNPKTQDWTKRDAGTGKLMDRKSDPRPFKGVRKEK